MTLSYVGLVTYYEPILTTSGLYLHLLPILLEYHIGTYLLHACNRNALYQTAVATTPGGYLQHGCDHILISVGHVLHHTRNFYNEVA